VIRAATSEDAAAIASLENLVVVGSWSEASVGRYLAMDHAFAFVESTGLGHVIGTGVADVGEIITIAVHPDARRSGVGTALLAAATNAWREAAVTEAFLEVRSDNDAARALYAGLQWHVVGTRKRYYADGTDALVLRQDL
jgi:ribosomal-protein-alanine N-acetyltransferase